MSPAAAKDIGVDAAVVVVLSKLDGIICFPVENMFFLFFYSTLDATASTGSKKSTSLIHFKCDRGFGQSPNNFFYIDLTLLNAFLRLFTKRMLLDYALTDKSNKKRMTVAANAKL